MAAALAILQHELRVYRGCIALSERRSATKAHIDNGFRSFVSASSFSMPDRLEASDDTPHIPFLFWLVEALEPTVIVEAPISDGASYFAMCQAVRSHGLSCRCFGIVRNSDAENEASDLTDYNEAHFAEFSTLVGWDAAKSYSDKIDLLYLHNHPDDPKLGDKVRPWLTRMSSCGVVLVQGSNAGPKSMALTNLLAEFRNDHTGFEFWHGGGLALYAVGNSPAPSIERLVSINADTEAARSIRAVYARLGLSVADRIDCGGVGSLRNAVARLQEQLRLQSYIAAANVQKGAELHDLRTKVDQLKKELKSVRQHGSFFLQLRSLLGQSPLGPQLRRLRNKLRHES